MHFQPTRYLFSEHVLAGDDELVQRVVTQLQSRLGIHVHKFQISGRADGLILRGQVGTHYCKQVVQEVVMEASGLSILANDIEVRGFVLAHHGTAAAK